MNNNLWLSICVPTYNRASLLEDLYNSIISQYNTDVEFVIVNDGSTDETEQLVNNWVEESKIKIEYFNQNNFGRGAALRKALLNAKGEYSIIMDDDDYFVEGALVKIRNLLSGLWVNKGQRKELAGICCLCLSENHNVVGDRFLVHHHISNFFEMRFFDNISGDKKEIIRTDILKNNIFPHFNCEKRVVTSTLWNKIAYDYDCLCVNEPVAVKRYIKGGMSDTLLSLKAQSPNYQIEDCITTINYPNQFSLRIILKYSSILWKYWFFGGVLSLSRINSSRLIFVIFSLPLGFLFYLRDRIKLRLSE